MAEIKSPPLCLSKPRSLPRRRHHDSSSPSSERQHHSSSSLSTLASTSSSTTTSCFDDKKNDDNEREYIMIEPYRDIAEFARLILYMLSSPAFIYVTYIQLVTLKHPDRIQLPAAQGFGRDTVFLTFHGNVLCTIYSCLCLLHSTLSLRPRYRRNHNGYRNDQQQQQQHEQYQRRGSSHPNRHDHHHHHRGGGIKMMEALERVTHKFSSPLFSLGFFVGAAYYLLIHFHPATRMRALMVDDFDQIMALLHLLPWVFVTSDALLKNYECWMKHNMGVKLDGQTIIIYGLCYACWSYFCVYMNGGDWPYPFQKDLNVFQHLLFVTTVLIVSSYLTKFANRIFGSFDRFSRLRWQARNTVGQI